MVALPVGQHGSTVAPKDTPHTPHLHRLLPIDAVPALPEPAPHEAQDASRDSGADAEVAGEIVHGSARAEEERELGVGHHREAVGKREWRARRAWPRSKRPRGKRTATRR